MCVYCTTALIEQSYFQTGDNSY